MPISMRMHYCDKFSQNNSESVELIGRSTIVSSFFFELSGFLKTSFMFSDFETVFSNFTFYFQHF